MPKHVCSTAGMLLVALGCGPGLPASASAAPEITNLSLRGLQSGGTTLLTIDGADLLPQPRVLLPFAVSGHRLLEGASASRVQLAVTLPVGISPGMYSLRLANAKGVSNAVVIGVDGLPQAPMASQIATLPAALHGTLSDSATVRTTFTGKKGQRIVADLEARRLGAGFDPVVELYDSRHVLVTYSQGKSTLAGDARLEAVLPADGSYSVELHDLLFQAAGPGFFRLKIGDLSYANLVFPLGGQRGKQTVFDLVGAVPPAESRLTVDLRSSANAIPAPLPASGRMTGPAPAIRISDLPQVADEPAGKQTLTPPIIINGRITKPHGENSHRLRVQPGMNLHFEVFANRVGSPLDAVLSVRAENGASLRENDDRPDTVDPAFDFTVPAGMTSLLVAVGDLEGRGGPNYLYQVLVASADRPDFRLSVVEDRITVPQDGTALLRVRADRVNYNGPIQLSLHGLPAGVQSSGQTISAGSSETLVAVHAPANVPLTQNLVSVVGESSGVQPPIVRTALVPETIPTQQQPWLRGFLGFAVTGPGPIQVAWDAHDPSLAIGSSFAGRVKVKRLSGEAGAVRLSLLTSQVAPRTADGKQEDTSRTLRLDGMPTVAANQSLGALRVLVPGDLPALPYDLAIKAELLAADGRTVTAAAFTPPLRLQAGQPLALQLASAAVQAKSGAGATGKLTGKIVRAGGFNKPVTISLTGLPAGLPAPSIMVPGDRSDFELPVALPYDTQPGPLQNVKIVASSALSAERVVLSGEIPVAVVVVKGDPPPPPPPLYPVFEDDATFARLLSEGDAQVMLEAVDRYSGTSALKIGGTQRFRTAMPGWGYKIAEKPGTGEFRYLRFAWKKRGGSNIMLQLNAAGKWGPARGKPGPSYRYEAGPGDNPFQAAALKIDSRLPDDWVVVTRDLYADFGGFTLTGIALTPGPGDYALFDHLYLARSPDDFKSCPPPIAPEQPLAIFEDQPQFVADLIEGAGTATLFSGDKYTGTASVRVTPDQRFNERLTSLDVRIRQNPGPGEYRFIQFAWKKKGGTTICLQLNHDGEWGPTGGQAGKFRYHAGTGPEPYGASLAVAGQIPSDWVVVTRDLYADFGEFTWKGIALSPLDGEYALFDHIYLGRTTRDFELVKPRTGVAK
jgi:hypothetical protein